MVRPLQYNAGLNLQEAEERYREVRDEFKKVKSHYSGLFGRFKGGDLSKEDNKTLDELADVLLPLSIEASVQNQVRQQQDYEGILLYRIGELQGQIMNYLANFKNTGVRRL